MSIAVLVSVIAVLFVVVALCEPLAARLRMPTTVVLAAVGIAIGATATFLLHTPLTDALNPAALAILNLPIRASTFLYLFLPTLLFQVALTINLRRMLDDWVPILVLAVIAVAVATLAVGLALWPLAGLPLAACLLLGAIVSTTDPSAVVTIFRATPAPQRLARIVEGESLLNDAAAIALFGVFFAYVSVLGDQPELGRALIGFPVLLVGGAALGWALAMAAVQLIRVLADYPLSQLSVSVALPYLTLVLAQDVMQVSGVVAVVAAGLTLNYTVPGAMSPPARETLRDTWDQLAYWAGSFIFILAALLIPRLLQAVRPYDLLLVGVVVVAAAAARAVILFAVLPALSALRLSPRVDPPYRIAILWGGLRGAVTLALALTVTESIEIPPEVRRLVGILATGFALFTLFVQGTTLRVMIRALGLDRLSPLDTALGAQVVAVALQSVRDDVAAAARDQGFSPETVEAELRRLDERLNRALAAAESAPAILDRDRVTLGLVALAGRERDYILDAFRDGTIPAGLAERMISNADRLIERTRAQTGEGGRIGYLAAARAAIAPGRGRRIAEWLHNRLRISAPLARITAERFALLLTLLPYLRLLHGFIDRRILRIHGRRVADLLHDLVARREEEIERALDELRLQFPGYAEAIERRMIRQAALRLEAREYDMLTDDGLIEPELRLALEADLRAARARLALRPRLDLALQKAELARCFPLFAAMKEAPLHRLARQLRTVYASPGDVLLRPDDRPRRVWFIASGTVEVEQAGETRRLGRGEMFGQFSVLTQAPRRARVTALTPCTLLSLDEARFVDLLRRNAALREAVAESARARGVNLDLAAFGARTAAAEAEAEAAAGRRSRLN
jgi:CPA1 family monovalent cation:H+ antiporter